MVLWESGWCFVEFGRHDNMFCRTFHVKRFNRRKKRFCRETRDSFRDALSAWNEDINTEEGGRVGANREE